MLQACRKPAMDKDGNTISYKIPIHNLRRFGCFVSGSYQLLSAEAKSKLSYMMVGYVHDSTPPGRWGTPNSIENWSQIIIYYFRLLWLSRWSPLEVLHIAAVRRVHRIRNSWLLQGVTVVCVVKLGHGKLPVTRFGGASSLVGHRGHARPRQRDVLEDSHK